MDTTYYVHLPHDGRALSHCFFFLRQFRQTLGDRRAVLWVAGDVDSEEAADIVVSSWECEPRRYTHRRC